jgi:hypothetical protein
MLIWGSYASVVLFVQGGYVVFVGRPGKVESVGESQGELGGPSTIFYLLLSVIFSQITSL